MMMPVGRAGNAPRAVKGIFVGCHERSGAPLFLTEAGAMQGKRIIRQAVGDRYPKDYLALVRGLPWAFKETEEHAATTGGAGSSAAPPPAVVVVSADATPVREPAASFPSSGRFSVTRELIDRYGPTDECLGCADVVLGMPRIRHTHNVVCVRRMREEIAKDAPGATRTSKRMRAASSQQEQEAADDNLVEQRGNPVGVTLDSEMLTGAPTEPPPSLPADGVSSPKRAR